MPYGVADVVWCDEVECCDVVWCDEMECCDVVWCDEVECCDVVWCAEVVDVNVVCCAVMWLCVVWGGCRGAAGANCKPQSSEISFIPRRPDAPQPQNADRVVTEVRLRCGAVAGAGCVVAHCISGPLCAVRVGGLLSAVGREAKW